MFDCILCCHPLRVNPRSSVTKKTILKRQPQHKGDIFSTSRSFPQGTRLTDDYSILALEAIGFSQELLQI